MFFPLHLLLSPPHRFGLHLDVTERCNLQCRHCYWCVSACRRDPPVRDLAEILARFKSFRKAHGELRSHGVTLGGGEPALRPDLEELVAVARAQGFTVRLVTNGTLVDARRARSLRRQGLRFAQVSIDGARETTHDRIRGDGTWARALEGVRALRGAGILVILSCVLIPGVNLDEAPFLLDLADQLRVGGVKFSRLLPVGRALETGLRQGGDYERALLEILRHASDIRFRRFLLLSDPAAARVESTQPRLVRGLWGLSTDLCRCRETDQMEVNAASGEVTFCRWREPLGNLHQQDLETIWSSHPVLQRARGLRRGGLCEGRTV